MICPRTVQAAWTCLYLYVILDVFRRYARESGEVAKDLIGPPGLTTALRPRVPYRP